MNTDFTIAVQCENYENRLCWMLSSIAQQIDGLIPITFMIAHRTRKTEIYVRIKEIFSKSGFDIVLTGHDKMALQYRGLIRNIQLGACQTEWMLFSDCDMVYNPQYFELLAKVVRKDEYSDKRDGMLIAGRYSNPIEETNALVDGFSYPQQISAAWDRADVLEKIRRGNVGAGYFQLINMKHCPHGGYYVDPTKCRDRAWYSKDGTSSGMHKTRSDHQFRRRIGKKTRLPQWFSQHQIHLNHMRDNQEGFHLEQVR